MRPTLTTARLTLRPLAAGSGEVFVERVPVPRAVPSPTDPQPSLPGIVEIWLPQQPDPALERLGLGSWIGYEDGTFVGWFHLTPGEGGTVVLGYRLRRRCWGKGLATEGAEALVEYAFESVGVRAVVAETVATNERSRAVLRKLGMHELHGGSNVVKAIAPGAPPRSPSVGRTPMAWPVQVGTACAKCWPTSSPNSTSPGGCPASARSPRSVPTCSRPDTG